MYYTESFYNTIEGLKGENLTTAVLFYLLSKKNNVFKQGFIDFLSNELSIKLDSQDVSIYHEKQYHRARPDLILKSSDTVIIIENKFFANFTNDQIKKYIELANDQFEPQKNKYVVILTIKHRVKFYTQELNKCLSEHKKKKYVKFITWNDLIVNVLNKYVDNFTIKNLKLFVENKYLNIIKVSEMQKMKELQKKEIAESLSNLKKIIEQVHKKLENNGKFEIGTIEKDIDFYGFGISHKEKNRLSFWFGYYLNAWLSENNETQSPLMIEISKDSIDYSRIEKVIKELKRIGFKENELDAKDQKDVYFLPLDLQKLTLNKEVEEDAAEILVDELCKIFEKIKKIKVK